MNSNRNPWPLGIVITFVFFFAGLAAVITLAATHPEHLVSKDYYEQELGFQNRLDAIARARQSGATAAYDAARGQLDVDVAATQAGRQLSGCIEFYRAAAPELDHQVPLLPQADGRQLLDVSRLAAGPWTVRVKWTAAGRDYCLEQKFNFNGR